MPPRPDIATSSTGPSSGRSARRIGAVGLALGVMGGFALMALAQSGPPRLIAQRQAPGAELPTAPFDLSGFQRRGNTLVGETVTTGGTRMRLVIDARTHALIGLRKLDSAASAGSGAIRACPDGKAAAPLPGPARNANYTNRLHD